MSFLKLMGITALILVILSGVLTSLFALDVAEPTQLFSLQTLQNPIQAAFLFLGVLILVLLIIFLSVDSTEEIEEPGLEQLHLEHPHPDHPVVELEDMEGVNLSYPTTSLQNEMDYHVESVNDKVVAPKAEPEFRRFLKNEILELEREKARIYHEVSLLDLDYRKGIITEKEFLMGTQLVLSDQGLQETIEAKDRQIQDCKAKLIEVSMRDKSI